MSDFYNILIVDDSKAIVHYLLDILDDKSHNLLYTFSKEEAKKIINQNEIDILICDLMLPRLDDGLETVRFFKTAFPTSKVLGISSNSSAENVVAVMKEGADDFVPKTSNREQIIKKIESLKPQVVRANCLTNGSAAPVPEEFIIGKSEAMADVIDKIRIVAENEVETCLIVGESGTGKEMVARTIHRLSPRTKKPFIAVNCAGMPDTLIDSELFGFERGSFTGAYNTSQGKFELADEGLLFLDEISEMPIHLQGKLLRVLENREVTRIGGKKSIGVDVMILAATNRDLESDIKSGRFREDIYFRLNMVKIEIPPLRERLEDLEILTSHFLKNVNLKLRKKTELSQKTMKVLKEYPFPGNVRELKNIIYSAALFNRSNIIEPQDVIQYFSEEQYADDIHGNASGKAQPVNRETLLSALRENNGNITLTAQQLGYTREGLSRKLKRMDIDKDTV